MFYLTAVANPGFLVVGGGGGGGRVPTLMWKIFGRNMHENERIGSCYAGHMPVAPPGSANE